MNSLIWWNGLLERLIKYPSSTDNQNLYLLILFSSGIRQTYTVIGKMELTILEMHLEFLVKCRYTVFAYLTNKKMIAIFSVFSLFITLDKWRIFKLWGVNDLIKKLSFILFLSEMMTRYLILSTCCNKLPKAKRKKKERRKKYSLEINSRSHQFGNDSIENRESHLPGKINDKLNSFSSYHDIVRFKDCIWLILTKFSLFQLFSMRDTHLA